jgi:hypothetical protein
MGHRVGDGLKGCIQFYYHFIQKIMDIPKAGSKKSKVFTQHL